MCRMNRQVATISLSSVLAVGFVMFPETIATATTRIWGDGNGSWSTTTGANWIPSGVPATGDTVNINIGGLPHAVTYDVAAVTLNSLTIDKTDAGTMANTLSMSANNLTSTFEYVGYNGRGIFDQSGGTNTIAAGTGFLDVGVYSGSMGTYNLSGTGALVANTNEYVGDIGTGVFNQTGGTNTISGAGHSLYMGYNASGTSGTYTLSAGALSVSSGSEYVGYSRSSIFNQSGGTNTAGTLYIYDASTYTLIGGTNTVGNLNLVGTYALSGGTLACNSSEYVDYDGTFNQTGGANNVANVLYVGSDSGSPSYNLGGVGTLSTVDETIGVKDIGTMRQTGGTHIVTGNLRIGDVVVDTSGDVVATTLGTYTLSAGQASVSSVLSVGSSAGGAGIMNVSGTGVLNVGGALRVYNTIYSSNGVHTSLNLSGGTINTAALDFGTPAILNWTSGKLNLTQSVTWDSAAATTTSVAFGSALVLGNNQTLMVTGNETLGGTGAFGLTLNSGSTHTVTGGITINPNGALTLSGGTLNADSLVVNGYLAFSSGTLHITGSSGLTIGAGGPLGSTVLINTAQTLNVTNTLSVNSGAYLAIAGGFSSGSLVNNGELVVINHDINGPVVNNHDVTVVGIVNFNGQVSGPGNFFGPGTTHLNGGLAPGASPADVSFEGSLALADTNTLFIEIGGTTPASQYDRLTIVGGASLDGALNVSLINGFTPSGGQQFTILIAGSIVNNGFVLAGSAASSFNLLVNSTSVILQAIGLPGDYNQNGVVDPADYVVWSKNVGTSTTLPNDLIGVTIGTAQYNQWRANFGKTAPGDGSGSGAIANAAVPEPATPVLLMFAAAGWCLQRGRSA